MRGYPRCSRSFSRRAIWRRAAAATSPFFFFNSIYTWPKLLAAWLFVTALAIVIQLWSSYVAGRWANVTQQWFGTYPIPLESPIDWVQWQQLMRHVPLIGFLCAGYVMLLWTRPRAALPDASLRVVRQLTRYAIATAAMLPPFARWTLLSLHVLLFATCYLFSVRTSVATPAAWRPWTFAESGVALVTFFVMLRAVPEAQPAARPAEQMEARRVQT